MRLGRLEVYVRPGSWCRPEEWAWGRSQPCEHGCVVLDVGWLIVTWYRGAHTQS